MLKFKQGNKEISETAAHKMLVKLILGARLTKLLKANRKLFVTVGLNFNADFVSIIFRNIPHIYFFLCIEPL